MAKYNDLEILRKSFKSFVIKFCKDISKSFPLEVEFILEDNSSINQYSLISIIGIFYINGMEDEDDYGLNLSINGQKNRNYNDFADSLVSITADISKGDGQVIKDLDNINLDHNIDVIIEYIETFFISNKGLIIKELINYQSP